jgi:hypothetical protein
MVASTANKKIVASFLGFIITVISGGKFRDSHLAYAATNDEIYVMDHGKVTAFERITSESFASLISPNGLYEMMQYVYAYMISEYELGHYQVLDVMKSNERLE